MLHCTATASRLALTVSAKATSIQSEHEPPVREIVKLQKVLFHHRRDPGQPVGGLLDFHSEEADHAVVLDGVRDALVHAEAPTSLKTGWPSKL